MENTKNKREIFQVLTATYREFGVLGIISIFGGVSFLGPFYFQESPASQYIFMIFGLALLCLAACVSNYRVKALTEQRRALIEMVRDVNARMAEQLGKSIPEDSKKFIAQKIRQTQNDLFKTIGNVFDEYSDLPVDECDSTEG